MPKRDEAAPTQDFVVVEDIRDSTVILKDGGLRKILAVSGINFDLKSDDEQTLLTSLFQNFLNTLKFPLQIFIHSRKVNVARYLENLAGREQQEKNEMLRNQIAEYREFITAFVSQNAIMDKSYFIVVPYAPVEVPKAGQETTKQLFGFLKKRGVAKPTERVAEPGATDEEKLAHHIEQVSQRMHQVIAGMNQLSLRVVELNDDELAELFYNIYNPEGVEKRAMGLAQAAAR